MTTDQHRQHHHSHGQAHIAKNQLPPRPSATLPPPPSAMALSLLRAALTLAIVTSSATTTAFTSSASRRLLPTRPRTLPSGSVQRRPQQTAPVMALEGPFLAAAQQDLALALVVFAEGAGATATNVKANWKTGAIGAGGAAALLAGWALMGQSFIAGAGECVCGGCRGGGVAT